LSQSEREKEGVKPLVRKSESKEKNRSLISYFKPKSPIVEQFRTIRTNIEYASIDEKICTILVTSSGPGEGKTTIISNLAVVMAQQGKKVLLIDADLRLPTIQYTFQISNSQGLTNVLTQKKSLEDVIVNGKIENLDLLPSGPIPPNPSELLASKAMDELIRQATSNYDLVLFDAPPVLAVTDAQILANSCDGTILVVSSGKTVIDEAKKAKELLVQAKAKLLGTVLNRKDKKESQYYYYYGQK
jgi:protein-tyrosine kinase